MGGKDSRDSDIIEDLGAQYRSFRCDQTEVGHKFFKLRDDKWRSCESIDMFKLFYEYLKQNENLLRQIYTKIGSHDYGTFMDINSSTLWLDDLVNIELSQQKKQYFEPAPIECDICRFPLKKEKYMIDGKIKNCDSWACMCADCFRTFGEGIAWGKGQLYLNNLNSWLLVAGSINYEEQP